MKLFWLTAGAAVGYVLGSKAGRERYEQIRATARDLANKPAVADAVDSVTAVVERGKDAIADKTTELAAKAKDAAQAKTTTETATVQAAPVKATTTAKPTTA